MHKVTDEIHFEGDFSDLKKVRNQNLREFLCFRDVQMKRRSPDERLILVLLERSYTLS